MTASLADLPAAQFVEDIQKELGDLFDDKASAPTTVGSSVSPSPSAAGEGTAVVDSPPPPADSTDGGAAAPAVGPECMALVAAPLAEGALQLVSPPCGFRRARGDEQAPRGGASEPMRCNLCLEQFGDRADGVSKGRSWWRCRSCYGCVQRMEGGADTEQKKQQLALLKKNKDKFRDAVLQLKKDHVLHSRSREAMSSYLETLVVTNNVQIVGEVTLLTQEDWEDHELCKGRSEAEATRSWEAALDDPKYHKTTDPQTGAQVIVKRAPSKVQHVRGQEWQRGIQQPGLAIRTATDQQKAMERLSQLASVDTPADASFSAVGGRWLRPPGSVPALPEGSQACPLELKPRALQRGQSDASDSGRAAASADGAAAPARPKGTVTHASLILQRSSVLTKLRESRKPLVRLISQCSRIMKSKNFQVIDDDSRRALNVDGVEDEGKKMLARFDALLAELPSVKTSSAASKIEEAEALLRDQQAFVQESASVGTAAQVEMKAAATVARKQQRTEKKEHSERCVEAVKLLAQFLPVGLQVYVGERVLDIGKPDTYALSTGAPANWNLQPVVVDEAPLIMEGLIKPVLEKGKKLIEEIRVCKVSADGVKMPALVRFIWKCEDNDKPGPPAWWSIFAEALQLPSDFQPRGAPGRLHAPWLVGLEPGVSASGAWQIPLAGDAMFVVGCRGAAWALWAHCESVDEYEGYIGEVLKDARPSTFTRLFGDAVWGSVVLTPGKVLWLPRGTTVHFMGLSGIGGVVGGEANALLTTWPAVSAQPWPEDIVHGRNHLLAALSQPHVLKASPSLSLYTELHTDRMTQAAAASQQTSASSASQNAD